MKKNQFDGLALNINKNEKAMKDWGKRDWATFNIEDDTTEIGAGIPPWTKTGHINVLDIKDNKDGSATMQVEMDDQSYNMLLIEGIKLLIPDDMKNKIAVIPYNEYIGKIPTSEIGLSDEEANEIIELAIVNALKQYIEKMDDKKSDKNQPNQKRHTARCTQCGKFIDKVFEFCSEKCWQKHSSKIKNEVKHCKGCGKFCNTENSFCGK